MGISLLVAVRKDGYVWQLKKTVMRYVINPFY